MKLPGLRKPIRAWQILLLAAAIAAIGIFGVLPGSSAGPETFQDPGYPVATTPVAPTPNYPVDETPGYPAATGTGTQSIPTFTLTPSSTATLPPDVRLTEEAEIGGSQSTPAPSATAGPSITPIFTQTTTPTITATPEPVVLEEEEGGWMDWGFFALGFSLPLLAGCGFILYWLDRRPDLFR